MAMSITAAAAPTVENIAVNSISVVVNDEPYIGINLLYNDRTYVDLRDIAEGIGCKVGWDDATQTASISGYFNESSIAEDVYTSFEEEYAIYVERYEKLIAEQEALAKQTYDDTMKQSEAATGGAVAGQTQLADAAAKPYYDRAEELRAELVEHEARLKAKYNVAD